jgi:nitrite reductase/ring-hydroxylating ferredoxin subunit
MSEQTRPGRWHEIDRSELPEDGRVRSVTVDGRSLAVSQCTGRFGALENRCPHQGGPLGEGSVEQGWLRCPGTATTTTR